MSTIVALNGVSYTIPAVGESGWGTQVSSYLIALSSGVLSKAGGTFTLTADADFGANYGLKSIYYKSRGTASTTGIVRLANAESVGWRNAGNSADFLLKVNSSNVLEFDGNPLLTLALGAADTALVMNAGATAYQFAKIANANVSASAAIVYSKLSLTGSIVNADVSASAAIAYSKLAALTASRALVSDGSGIVSVATTTSTQLGYLSAATGTTGTTSTNLVYSASPTITNAVLSGPIIIQVDSQFTVQASGSPTSKFTFDASSITAGQTRNIVIPDANLTVVGTTTTQTLSGKTLTSPLINTPNIDCGSAATGRILLPNGSTSLLNGRPRAKGAIYYDLDLDILKYDNNANLIPLQSDVSTTKGDLFVRTSSVVTRLGVGSNNQILVADSAQTEGVKWASTLSGLTLTSPNFGTSAIMKAAAPLKFNNSGDTFFTALQAGTLAASTTFTLPVADGSANQVLKTDGSAALGWASVLTSSLSQYNLNVGDSSNMAQSTNSNLLGDFLASYVSGTFTVTIAAPGVVSYTSHGLITGDRVYLTTTGALPTGLSASTAYFVVKVDANSFNLATTYVNALAGTKITTTGSQSGVHTCVSGGINRIQNTRANVFTAVGDLQYSNDTTGNPKKLTIGSTGQLLTVSGGIPAWSDTIAGTQKTLSTYIDGSSSTSGFIVEAARTSPSSADSQNVYSGTYTPTLTAGAGTITPGAPWYWYRTGNTVTVFGYAATNGSVTASVMSFTLPITPAAFSATFGIAATQLQGTLFQNDTHVQIAGNSSDTKGVTVNNIGAGVTTLYFHFSYRIS